MLSEGELGAHARPRSDAPQSIQVVGISEFTADFCDIYRQRGIGRIPPPGHPELKVLRRAPTWRDSSTAPTAASVNTIRGVSSASAPIIIPLGKLSPPGACASPRIVAHVLDQYNALTADPPLQENHVANQRLMAGALQALPQWKAMGSSSDSVAVTLSDAVLSSQDAVL